MLAGTLLLNTQTTKFYRQFPKTDYWPTPPPPRRIQLGARLETPLTPKREAQDAPSDVPDSKTPKTGDPAEREREDWPFTQRHTFALPGAEFVVAVTRGQVNKADQDPTRGWPWYETLYPIGDPALVAGAVRVVRLEGTCTRAHKGSKETDATQRAKVGFCPFCAKPTHIANPSRYVVGEVPPGRARGVSLRTGHGPWAARFFAASLCAQEWTCLPSDWDWAAQPLAMSGPTLFGGASGSLRYLPPKLRCT